MEKLIKDKLAEIEKDNGFKILYACETGSRAWGFPSPDSDYDVRFIYVQDLDWHLSLRDRKNSFEALINDLLDITGWELKKSLELLWKSNAAMLERIQSPVIYHSNSDFLKTIQSLGNDCFSPIGVMHHYLSMSKKYFDACQESEMVRLKKYFYALRTAIAGKWVREEGTIPHIEMPRMLEIVDEEVRKRIYELIDLKITQNEDYLHPQEPLINDFLRETIAKNDEVANDLPAGKGNMEKLDDFYRRMVKGEFV